MDLLTLFIHLGGTATVVLVCLYFMGKWFLGKLNAAIESYVNAYAQESAKIGARIQHLEELAQEQGTLTRTIKTIKDEIAAEAKTRDNRWAFRKDIYVRLITSLLDVTYTYTRILNNRRGMKRTDISDEYRKHQLQESLQAASELESKVHEYQITVGRAPLASADGIIGPFNENVKAVEEDLPDNIDDDSLIENLIEQNEKMLTKLHEAGRKELWPTQLKANAMTQGGLS
jgi:hypothetical protein